MMRADVVVIDLNLRSDEAMSGLPGWHLMAYCYEQCKRIVAISGENDVVHPHSDEPVRVIRRPVGRREFMKAMRTTAKASASAN